MDVSGFHVLQCNFIPKPYSNFIIVLGSSKNALTPADLWVRFLRFYALEFDWLHCGISIRQSSPYAVRCGLTRFIEGENSPTKEHCAHVMKMQQTMNLSSGITYWMLHFVLDPLTLENTTQTFSLNSNYVDSQVRPLRLKPLFNGYPKTCSECENNRGVCLDGITTEQSGNANIEEPCVDGEAETNPTVLLRISLKSVVEFDLDLNQVKQQLNAWISNCFVDGVSFYIS